MELHGNYMEVTWNDREITWKLLVDHLALALLL